MKLIVTILRTLLLCVLVPVLAHAASPSDSKALNQKQRATSVIFNDIMQTLPNTMKARVDSASTNIKNKRSASSADPKSTSDSRSVTSAARKDGAVQNLPEDVRGKVEKAIIDIDLMNQDRQVQFKEYEKKHPGSK